MSMKHIGYRVCQPTTLESLAIQKFGEWIASQVPKLQQRNPTKPDLLLSQHIQNIRHHLEYKVPGKFHDKLAESAIKAMSKLSIIIKTNDPKKNKASYNTQMEIKGLMVESLYTKSVTALSFPLWINSYGRVQDSLCSKSYLLTGLTRLELPCKLEEALIIQLLKELKQLKYLKLPYACTENILKCLVENCKLIEELNVCFSKIGDECMCVMIMLHNLRSVELFNTAVSKKGIEILLTSSPNIERIGTKVNMVKVLNHIASIKGNAGKQLKLKSLIFMHDWNFYYDFRLIIYMCPLLEHVHLLTSTHDVRPLGNLIYLRKLEFNSFEFYKHYMAELLDIKGSSIEHLHLNCVKELDLTAFIHIIVTCPNLKSLTICGPFAKEDLYFYDIDNIPPLRHLKRLTLKLAEAFPLTDKYYQQLHLLLSHCPNLEFIKVSKIGTLTDIMMLDILNENPKQFMFLKHLEIGQYVMGPGAIRYMMKHREKGLSKAVLDRIVQSCITPPEIESYYD